MRGVALCGPGHGRRLRRENGLIELSDLSGPSSDRYHEPLVAPPARNLAQPMSRPPRRDHGWQSRTSGPLMTGRIQTLGGFDIVIDGRATDVLKNRPTCSAVSIYLALERKATRDSILAILWPESSESRARHSLSQTLYQLRGLLGTDWLVRKGQELRLAEGIAVDAADLERALRERRFGDAAALYGGRFLEGWHFRGPATFQHWVDRQAERLESLYRTASRRGIAACLDAGDRAGARALAERWAGVEPYASEPHRELIRLLVEEGKHEAALDCHAVFERRLAELDLLPGPEIEEAIAPARSRRSPPLSGVARESVPLPRIVVLPFTHAGPSERAHATYGLADEATVRLARHSGLAVIARSTAFTFAGKARSPREIGEQLQVDYVLEGTVRWRRAGTKAIAIVCPRLVRMRDGRQLWAQQLETDDRGIAKLHVPVVDRVLSTLRLPPLPRSAETAPGEARNPAAHELYLRGLQHWHQRSPAGLQAAVDLFIQAIELEPGHGRAYAGLALAYAVMPSFLGDTPAAWMPRAKHAAERALELDPEGPEAHLARGVIAWNQDLDGTLAGRHWKRALELKPSNAQALVWQGYRSAALKRAEEAGRLVGEALRIDPLSVSTNFDAGLVRWHIGDREEALTQMRRVLQIDPVFVPAAFILGAHHLARGEVDDARREWSRIRLFGPSWQTLLQHLDDAPRALAAVDRIVEISPRPVNWYATAHLYVLFGAPERALFWIQTHLRSVRGEPVPYPTGGPSLFHAVCDPAFEALRSSPEFQGILRALHLDAASE